VSSIACSSGNFSKCQPQVDPNTRRYRISQSFAPELCRDVVQNRSAPKQSIILGTAAAYQPPCRLGDLLQDGFIVRSFECAAFTASFNATIKALSMPGQFERESSIGARWTNSTEGMPRRPSSGTTCHSRRMQVNSVHTRGRSICHTALARPCRRTPLRGPSA